MSYFQNNHHIFAFAFSFFQQKKISMAELLLLIKGLKFPNFRSVPLWLQKTQILNTLG